MYGCLLECSMIYHSGDLLFNFLSSFCLFSHLYHKVRLRDYGVLDFDAGDARRQPPIDTTWQQVFNTRECYF